MPDYFGLPDNSERSQWFNYTGSWQVWNKPRGITMVHMLCIGPGQGGAGGYSAGGATYAGGGGGGSPGGMSSLVIPAAFLPDILYIYAAGGGLGGIAGSAAGTVPTALSAISAYPVAAALGQAGSAYLWSSAAQGTAPGAGTSSGTSPGGTVTTVWTPVNGFLATAGTFSAAVGFGGGQSGTPPAAINFYYSSCLGLGNAGAITTGSVNFAGGGFVFQSSEVFLPTVNGGAAGGGRGQDGFAIRQPMCFIGGAGGGSNFSGTGGAGGNGAIGCGGGGGGGGVVGGAGGNGGPGLGVVTAWL